VGGVERLRDDANRIDRAEDCWDEIAISVIADDLELTEDLIFRSLHWIACKARMIAAQEESLRVVVEFLEGSKASFGIRDRDICHRIMLSFQLSVARVGLLRLQLTYRSGCHRCRGCARGLERDTRCPHRNWRRRRNQPQA